MAPGCKSSVAQLVRWVVHTVGITEIQNNDVAEMAEGRWKPWVRLGSSQQTSTLQYIYITVNGASLVLLFSLIWLDLPSIYKYATSIIITLHAHPHPANHQVRALAYISPVLHNR